MKHDDVCNRRGVRNGVCGRSMSREHPAATDSSVLPMNGCAAISRDSRSVSVLVRRFSKPGGRF